MARFRLKKAAPGPILRTPGPENKATGPFPGQIQAQKTTPGNGARFDNFDLANNPEALLWESCM